MRIIIFTATLFLSHIVSATSDYNVPLKKVVLESIDGKSSVEVKLDVESFRTEQIRINTEFGTFDIPKEHVHKLLEPDLHTIEFLYNPGGIKLTEDADGSMNVKKWGLYYVFKMYFDDESTDDINIDNDDRPQFIAVIENGKLRDVGIKRVAPCKKTAIKCWRTTRTQLDLGPTQPKAKE